MVANAAPPYGGMTNEQIADASTAELKNLVASSEALSLEMDPVTASALTGLVALAMRHPGIAGKAVLIAQGTAFVSIVERAFRQRGCPAMAEAVRRSLHPEHDVTVAT